MTSIKKRMDSKQRKEAISTMEMIIRGLKNGTIEIETQGIWRALYAGRYEFRTVFRNLREFSKTPDQSE